MDKAWCSNVDTVGYIDIEDGKEVEEEEEENEVEEKEEERQEARGKELRKRREIEDRS